MEQWLERMLLICLIIAMGNLIFRLAKNQIQNPNILSSTGKSSIDQK